MRTAVYAQSLVLGVAIAVSAYAGDLNPPPGPIGPTMKKLDEVEPRIALIPEIPEIRDAVYLIDQAGSYYLTGNAVGVAGKHGILITASDVTLDLMGYSVVGVAGSLDGIAGTMLPITVHNVTIHDGTVRDWGGNGVNLSNVSLNFRKIEVSDNGGHGAVLGSYSHLEEVSFRSNGGNGAMVDSYAHMEEVSFASNGGMGAQIGSYAHMEEVSFSYNGGGGAIVGSAAHMEEVSFCYNTGNGLEAGDTCIITKCTAEENTLDGIVTGESVSMTDVVVSGNGGRGIVLTHHGKRGPAILSTVRANGNGGDGIVLGENATCTACAAVDNLGRGIVADKSSPQLHKALAVGNGGDGIVLGENGTCENCTASGNTGRGIVADKASPQLHKAMAIGNAGDGIVLGDGGSAENCTSRGNGGIGIWTKDRKAIITSCIAEGNSGDGIVVAPGSTLTDCQALNNGGNGLTVKDNNVPPRTSTTLLRGCVARSNSNMGFKIVIPPGAAQVPTRDQGIATPAAPVAPMPLDVGKATAGASVRPTRGASFAMPLASVRFAGTGFGCVAEENLGDGFYLDGDWMLSQCVSRNNGGIGVNAGDDKWKSWFAEVISEGNISHGFSVGGGSMQNCIARNNGGNGIYGHKDEIIIPTCVSEGNTLDGFVVGPGSALTDCQALNNGGNGIRVEDNNVPPKTATVVLRGCVARGNGGNGVVGEYMVPGFDLLTSLSEGNGLNGIVVGSGSILRNCTARNNGSLGAPGGGAGILVTGEANRIEENYVQGNMRGIDVDGAGNIIVKNTAVNNSVANYDIASGSSYGPILNVGAGGDLSALSGGDQPTANMSMTCPSWYADSDGDGYGDAAGSQQACAQPAGYVSEGTDCDDTNASIYPGATEVCNGLDDDCDGAIDEGAGTIWYLDWDGDGYGDPSNALLACTQPPGRVADFSDCDDTNATVHPGAVELCNGVDDDCDQTIDEGCPPPP